MQLTRQDTTHAEVRRHEPRHARTAQGKAAAAARWLRRLRQHLNPARHIRAMLGHDRLRAALPAAVRPGGTARTWASWPVRAIIRRGRLTAPPRREHPASRPRRPAAAPLKVGHLPATWPAPPALPLLRAPRVCAGRHVPNAHAAAAPSAAALGPRPAARGGALAVA